VLTANGFHIILSFGDTLHVQRYNKYPMHSSATVYVSEYFPIFFFFILPNQARN